LLDDNKQYVRRDAVSNGCCGGAGLDPREAQSIYLGRLIRGGGIIFLDDYQTARRGTSRILRHHQPGLDAGGSLHPDALHQWAVLPTTTTKPKERPFDYFIDF
jgi:hypothetical protein